MKQKLLNAFIMNFFLSIGLSLTQSLRHGGLNVETIYSILIAFGIGFIVSLIIPFDKISMSISKLCHIKNPIIGILVGGLAVDCIPTLVLSLSMTLFAMRNNLQFFLSAWVDDLWVVYLVSYVLSTLVNISMFLIFSKRQKGMINE